MASTVCGVCGQEFKNAGAMKMHQRKKHPLNEEQEQFLGEATGEQDLSDRERALEEELMQVRAAKSGNPIPDGHRRLVLRKPVDIGTNGIYFRGTELDIPEEMYGDIRDRLIRRYGEEIVKY